ncbi:hypothetical protein CIPAW_05G122700 [Carya illinoinensis]|uniref:Uncharacterized protein n=1 Tax=Carya illinoinensis TaxID=32201 RepID=A0A8T1QIT2_CARIL|nr:hypothetical protein CIPAW_05G122700 [Carya illinoinensis]
MSNYHLGYIIMIMLMGLKHCVFKISMAMILWP